MQAGGTKPTFAIVGPGRVGRAMARLLVDAGYPFAGIIARQRARAEAAVAELLGGGGGGQGAGSSLPDALADRAAVLRRADMLFVTTPDRAIKAVAAKLAAELPSQQAAATSRVAFHTSGALSAAELAPLQAAGYAVASLHPNQTFADAAAATELLRGIAWGVEGDAVAVAKAYQVVAALQGTVLPIDPSRKALYHAGACVASNYLAVLLDMATRLYEAAGIPAGQARAALVPLIQGSLSNAVQMGLPEALTGPIERGDVRTVQHHLDAMRRANVEPQIELMYRMLGQGAVGLAQAKTSITPEAAEGLHELLREASSSRTLRPDEERGEDGHERT